MGLFGKSSAKAAGKRIKSYYPTTSAHGFTSRKGGPLQIGGGENPGTYTQKTLGSKKSTTKRI